MLRLTKPAVILVTAASASLFLDSGAPLLDVEALASGSRAVSRAYVTRELLTSLRPPASLSLSAHYTFTSGSTGPPKAVVLSHRALLQFIMSMRAFELSDGGGAQALGAGTRMLQLSRCSFDISWLELVGVLCVGGATVLLPPSIDENLDMSVVKGTQ